MSEYVGHNPCADVLDLEPLYKGEAKIPEAHFDQYCRRCGTPELDWMGGVLNPETWKVMFCSDCAEDLKQKAISYGGDDFAIEQRTRAYWREWAEHEAFAPNINVL